MQDQNQTRAAAWTITRRVLIGAVAGMIASIPMAGMMIGLNRVLPGRKRSFRDILTPLPPKLITRRVTRRAGIGQITRSGRKWDLTTWLAHLGYGAAAASLYPVITRPLPVPHILRGMLFALGIWGASYMGWLPAANILPPAKKQTARRNAVMILSHLTWGSIIAILADGLNRAWQVE